MTITISLDSQISETYMVHSALLAIKLLALSPLAAMTWVRKGLFSHPDDVRRAYLYELKNLAPYWIVAGFYVTTNPKVENAVSLFRMYTAARMIVILGYATHPLPAVFTDFALVLSYIITLYMSLCVIYCYRSAL